ncbi:MAG: DUF927 domain-containing protein [Clostridiaceae bacterium]|nr:DUF927 domain-containing protein [Clostridiaceae bacterium]
MELSELLQRLHKVKGSDNQYSALCPVHDDKNASLSVSQADNGKILLKCQAGCSTEKIVSALRLTMSNLFPEKAYEPKAKKKVVAEYLYKNADGETIHKKIRYSPKSFTQAHLENGKWIFNLKGITPLLYNLPEVLEGIKDNKPIYIAEGEKDCLTLKKHEKIATCNTHGAGEGKWLSHYNDYLINASVIIIADNDKVGKDFAEEIANNLIGIAKSVKLIDLTRIIPDLKEHGDITDLFDTFDNDTEALKLLDELVDNTPLYEPKKQGIDEYSEMFYMSGYSVHNGNTVQKVEKSDGSTDIKILANFVAWCNGEKTVDDGAEAHKYFQLVGKHSNGRSLPQIDISASEFSNMSWVTKMWGFNCNINSGSCTKDKLRHCIQQVSKNLKQETIYTYSGWCEYKNKWIYLHGNGAVGADNITVKLEGKLSHYKLPEARQMKYTDTVVKSVILMDIAPRHITTPLLAFTYLSPLNEFLKQAGHEPRFVYYLMGKTGAGKSTLAALFLSFFGSFSNSDLPLSFMDTANAIVNQTFLAKDNLICIDDYKPGNKQDVNKMDSTAQVILRSYGERTGRNRLKSDSTLMTQRAPRGNAIITGEQPPNVGESGTARLIVSELFPGDIDYQKLTTVQGYAKNNDFSLCMRGYIEWLKSDFLDKNKEAFVDKLSKKFEDIRSDLATALNGTTHPRCVEALAHLYIGYQFYLAYCEYVGVAEPKHTQQLIEEFYNILLKLGAEHAELSYTDKPSTKFIIKLRELINTKAIFINRIDGFDNVIEKQPFVGYFDDDNYYFYAETIYKCLVDFCCKQGELFPIGLKTLLKHLADENMIIVENGDRTPRRTIQGKRSRFLVIPKSKIDE